MKRLISTILIMLVAFSFSLSVYADETSADVCVVEDLNMEIILPEDTYVFWPTTGLSDELWAEAGIDDPSDYMQTIADMEAYAMFSTNNGEAVAYLTSKVSDGSESYFNFNDMVQEDFDIFVASSNYDESGVVSVATEYNNGSQRFVFLQSIGLDTDYVTTVYEDAIFTIINGAAITFYSSSYETVTEESTEFLKELVDGTTFTVILDAADYAEMTDQEAIWAVIASAVLIVGLIAFFIYFSIRAKKTEKATKDLAERISNYRRNRTSSYNNSVTSFSNTTEVTDAVIKKYANYHCYIKKLPGMIISTSISILSLVLLNWLDADWWINVLMVALIGYNIFKFIAAEPKLERTLKRVFAKMNTRKATYTFHEDEFLITGIESGEFHPYFQIVDLREYKDYYYMYFSENNCYYISKAGFTVGREQDFKDFMMRKTGKRFR